MELDNTVLVMCSDRQPQLPGEYSVLMDPEKPEDTISAAAFGPDQKWNKDQVIGWYETTLGDVKLAKKVLPGLNAQARAAVESCIDKAEHFQLILDFLNGQKEEIQNPKPSRKPSWGGTLWRLGFMLSLATLYTLFAVGCILSMFGDAPIPFGVAFLIALFVGIPSYFLASFAVDFKNTRNEKQ